MRKSVMVLIFMAVYFLLFNFSTFADEYSRYNEIQERIKLLGFHWTPVKAKNIDSSKSSEQSDLGLLWEMPKGTPLPPSSLKRALPTRLSWLEYNPATGNDPNLPAGKYVSCCNYQLQCGSCWAFGAIHVFEAVYRIAERNPNSEINMSQQILVSCSSNWGCNGGWPSTTANFLKEKGTWNDSCYPYLAQDGNCSDSCIDYQNGTHSYKITNWHSVNKNLSALKTALCEYGPVYTTMTVYDDFRHYYTGGIYQLTPGSQYIGGHAIAIVGYDDDQQCFIGQNSWDRLSWEENPPSPWGEDFNGDRGYFRIHYDQLDSSVNFGGNSIVFEYSTKK